jgi:tetratricopeptide (TPR) repeat protein
MPPFQNIFRKKTPKKADPQSEPPGSSASSLELARSLQEEGRLDDALKEYEAVLKRLSSTGLDIKLRMKVQEDIAFLHLRRNDLSAAEEGFAMHLKMRRKDMGQGDRVTLGASLNLARVYIDQRKMGEAMKLICSALKAFDEKDGNDCREKFEAMACLADVYIHEGRAEDACTLYQKALSALESTSGPDDRHTLDTKYSLAMAHASMGRYIKAVDLLKEVLVTIEIDASGGNKGSLRARARLCRIYLKMSKIKEAEIELRRCFEEGEEMGLRTNKYVVEATQDLMALYRLDGKVDAIIPLHAWIKGENIVMPLSAASKMSTPSVIINNPPEKSGLILEEDSGVSPWLCCDYKTEF